MIDPLVQDAVQAVTEIVRDRSRGFAARLMRAVIAAAAGQLAWLTSDRHAGEVLDNVAAALLPERRRP